MKRLLDGALLGAGFIAVVAVAFAIAWAGDVFTIDRDGALKFAVSDQGKITVGATESYVNLVIQNDGTTPNSRVNITADVLTVEGIRLENVNVSANIASSGAGGLDTGTEAANGPNKWYYIWVITNNTGSLVNGILTLAPDPPNPPTPPAMPSGYTKKRRVGAVWNDGSSNFLKFVQEGNRVLLLTGQWVVVAGTSTSFATVDCSSGIPASSRTGIFEIAVSLTHSVANVSFNTFLARNGESGGQVVLNAHSQVANVNVSLTGEFMCVTDDTQKVAYKIQTAPNVSGGAYIAVWGYYDRM